MFILFIASISHFIGMFTFVCLFNLIFSFNFSSQINFGTFFKYQIDVCASDCWEYFQSIFTVYFLIKYWRLVNDENKNTFQRIMQPCFCRNGKYLWDSIKSRNSTLFLFEFNFNLIGFWHNYYDRTIDYDFHLRFSCQKIELVEPINCFSKWKE